MAKKIRYCRWTYDAYYDNYDTACGQAFALIDGEDVLCMVRLEGNA